METVKELQGFSGSRIYLMKDNSRLFVRKIGNVKRNYERLNFLSSHNFSVPKIYNYEHDVLDLEYIHGLDMKKYLQSNDINLLKKFIFDTLDAFAQHSVVKDYTEVYQNKLQWIDRNPDLPFTKLQLIDRLPAQLPSSIYHGDLTLENILYSNGQFYMIDGAFVEYDSYVFDIAKMRQDLECKWFLRQSDLKIDIKVQNLQTEIFKRYPIANDNYLLILMLLRVLAHARDKFNYDFLIREIKRLWK
jgi:RIO-like serine/threonine protein kinase